MVRVAGNNCVLDAGGDQKSPPLPFIEVDEDTARALVGTGVAVLVGDEVARAVEWAEAENAASVAAQAELAAHVAAEAVTKVEDAVAKAEDAAGSNDDAGDDAAEDVPGGNAERRQAIIDAFDLLEPEHFVKTGARAGRPKLNAVEDITEIRDLTVAEIDALFAAREDAADA